MHWDHKPKKRSRGWKHGIKIAEAYEKAKERSREPGTKDRTRQKPSLPKTPWDKEKK